MDPTVSAGRDLFFGDEWRAGSGESEQLRLETVEAAPGVLVLAVTGEIDMLTQEALLGAVTKAVHAACRHVVVDLSGVTYMGSVGLSVLAEAHDLARERGIGFCPAAASPTARRVLELTGLDVAIGYRDTVAEVLAELS